MTVVISDLGEGTGFSIVNGVLESGNIDDPTCVVCLTKDTLAAILTSKITQQQAFLMGGVDITGNDRLRDSIVLNRIFDEMKSVIVKT
jgi:putative sterol carrier protein